MGVKLRCRPKISFFFGVCLIFYVLFCQKHVVCLVCNDNVLRDVTKFLTERVQMKQISTCIIINLKQTSQSDESESIWKNVFLNFVMLAMLLIAHADTCTNHQHSSDGQFHHHVKSHPPSFFTQIFLK